MQIIRKLLGAFDSESIEYCVLRNYEDLSAGQIQRDIDVLVSSDNRLTVEAVLRSQHWQEQAGDTTVQTEYVKFSPEQSRFVTVDLYWDFPTYNGLPLADGQQILDRRQRMDDWWVPKAEDFFVALLLHAVLNKNEIKPEYRRKLDDTRGSLDQTDVRRHARKYYGELGERVVSLALDGQYEQIPALKWNLIRANLQNAPLLFPYLVWNLIIRREVVQPVLRFGARWNVLRNTPVVAVLGPDGVGKSTTVDGTVRELREQDIDAASKTMGVHSGISPFLRIVKTVYDKLTGQATADQDAADPDGDSATIPTRSSSLKALVLWIDFVIRYVVAQLSGAEIVIADRYIHELGVYTHPGSLSATYCWLEPSAFYAVVLHDDPELIAERSEFDEASVREFYNRLNSVGWQRLDVSSGPEQTVDDVSQISVFINNH